MDSAIGLLLLLALSIPVMAIAALIIALGTREAAQRRDDVIADLGRKLAEEHAARTRLAQRVAALEAGATEAGEPAETPAPEPSPAPVIEPISLPTQPATPTSVPPVAPSPPAPHEAPAAEEPVNVEGELGARWAVWIGGLALGLGGVFLVRYAIEQGLLGPAARLSLGGLLAAFLISAGEWLRRRERDVGSAWTRQAYIPGVLTAAGSSTAFAVVFAAHGLYDFLGPAPAFALLAIVSVATLLAALLHGPWMAALGILAAYVTPFFVASQTPNVPALLAYLAFVTATATALGKLRGWIWLTASAHAAAVLWAFAPVPHVGELSFGLYALALSLIAFGPRIIFGDPSETRPLGPDSILAGALGTGHALVMLAATVWGEHQGAVLPLAAGFAVIQLAGAWRSAAFGPLTAVAGLFSVGILALWDLPFTTDPSRGAVAQPPAGFLQIPPASVDDFVSFGTGLGALFLLLGLRGAWRGASTIWLAGAGAITPVALVAMGYARIADFQPSVSFAFLSLGLAIVLATAAELAMRKPPPGADAVIALFSVGTVAGLCLGLAVILEKGWLTAALALVSLGIAWIEQSRPAPPLRVLAAAVAGLVVLRLIWYPLVTDDPGATPIFNWLLWGYGVPAAAFALAARLFRGAREDLVTRIFEALATIYAGLTVSLQIRHFVTGGDMFTPSTLMEAGLQTSAVLGFSLALQRLQERSPSPIFAWTTQALGFAGLAMIALWLAVVANPLLTGEPMEGSLLINPLLPGYLLPALAAAVRSLEWRRIGETALSNASAAAALTLAFIWTSLTVRWLYQGPDLAVAVLSSNELYAYSAVWLLLALALLGAGIATGRRWLRTASAIVLAPTILKVFIIDMAHLEGVLRAFSFLGLGAALIGVGLLYQKLLLHSRPEA